MTYLHVGSRVPVLFMRINVAKEDVYLCRILAVEVRRVKCVFPRNEVQKEIEAFPRRTENRVEGEVVLWGNWRILFLKIFAITDGGSSHYQDVRFAASLCSSYIVPTHPPLELVCIGVYTFHPCFVQLFAGPFFSLKIQLRD